MEYLQYFMNTIGISGIVRVLNLIINGIPSILKYSFLCLSNILLSFKPYYKWNTFNTTGKKHSVNVYYGSFKPYYKWNTFNT